MVSLWERRSFPETIARVSWSVPAILAFAVSLHSLSIRHFRRRGDSE